MAAPKGNNFALGNTGGRPPKYETPDELDYQITLYFDYCKKKKEKATITGLALFLGFDSRQSLFDYAKHEEFSCIINRAKLSVENSYELSGQMFDIFALKNMGWKDKTETGLTDKNGNDVRPTILLQPAPNCEPLKAD